jgi:hypothetical protein
MWWRRSFVSALLIALGVAFLWREDALPPFPRPLTPHDSYARSLEREGLAGSALGREWLTSAREALFDPTPMTLPAVRAIDHASSAPRAYGYALDLERGRLLTVGTALDSPARVFIDLFRIDPGESPRHVASGAAGASGLEYEITRQGRYVVRVQPELFRRGRLRIAQRTLASLTFPVRGRDARAVKSYFRDPRDGGRRDHHGVDIFAPRGTPVVAAAPGVVTSVGTNRLGGLVVWVWDPRRHQSHYYAHLSSQSVRTGEPVAAGDVVGQVGNTGNARTTAPHLHFGIYEVGEGPIDPLPFVSGPGRADNRRTAARADAGTSGTAGPQRRADRDRTSIPGGS